MKVTVWVWPELEEDSFATLVLSRICTTSAPVRPTVWVWPLPTVSSTVRSPPAES